MAPIAVASNTSQTTKFCETHRYSRKIKETFFHSNRTKKKLKIWYVNMCVIHSISPQTWFLLNGIVVTLLFDCLKSTLHYNWVKITWIEFPSQSTICIVYWIAAHCILLFMPSCKHHLIFFIWNITVAYIWISKR